MSTGLSNDFKEQVRAQTNLVELIGESITLISKGRDFVGLCPFHDDKNPSLTVSSERQSYKCWSCSEGGDCFSWVMNYDKLEFRDALELLARRANLEMPAHQHRGPKTDHNAKQILLDALTWAENELHQYLLNAADAQRGRDYLAERGFTAETIAAYRIGYHPNSWDWTLQRATGKFTPEQLVACRLAAPRKNTSGYRDDLVFIDRVVFPIHNERGRPVAFGGRILPDSPLDNPAKYLNGSESSVFTKSRLVYGLDVARESIRQTKTVLVVEGYTDCMMLSQHGVKNVVATLGTALADSHVQLLRRFAQRVVLVYDGDDPGKDAAERAVAKFLSQEVDLRVLTLPAGQDPADYLQEHGADEFRSLADNALEALEFKLKRVTDRYGFDTVDGGQRVLNEMVELLAVAPRLAGTVREDVILGKLAQRLRMQEGKIRQSVADARRNSNRQQQPRHEPEYRGETTITNEFESYGTISADEYIPETTSLKHERLEREILEIIFAAPETVQRISEEVAVSEFHSRELRALLQICFDIAEQGDAPSYERVTSAIEEPALKRLAVEIDGLSIEKQLGDKLRLDRPSAGSPSSLLDEVLSRLKWRRQTNGRAMVSDPQAESTSSPGNLDPSAKERLRRMTELRQADPTMKLRLNTGRNR